MADIESYLLPGQLGLIGFYDLGKTWSAGDNSDTIHQGLGGGVYFSPVQMAIIKLVAGYSKERWYPHFTLGFRF